ncbi:dynein light chain LC6, flagellar outer arm-like [Sesamum indicum]|uniref:Dynein light chain n=1 Tax=Sesamum indicum TaxID=4182 RepID=A0A6I9TA87_SESIN|nr:dynein light chain LC6, flagellar outer arm-like [Sesamum indicum]
MSDYASITSAAQSRGKQVDVKLVEMKRDMMDDAINIAVDALSMFSVHQDVAEYMKKMFDKKHGAPWHCIVGHYFGSYVSHEKDSFIYFHVDNTAVLLYKSGVIVRG